MNLKYPNITGKTPVEQIVQLKSFLYQLVEELNLQEGSASAVVANAGNGKALPVAGSAGGKHEDGETPVATFTQIRDLIIKSADIVNAYYEEINSRLDGVYVAESDFGTYRKEISQEIQDTADGITRKFASLQELSGKIEALINTEAYVRQGLLFTVGEENLEEELGQDLDDGAEVYGVEVGQTIAEEGVETFRKFARFTAYGMTLYDNNGELSAYITDSRLNIPHAVIKNSFIRGGFEETINSDGSTVERWVGA